VQHSVAQFCSCLATLDAVALDAVSVLVLELLVIVVAASVQAMSGFGFAVIAVPILASIAGIDHAIAVAGVLGLTSSMATARHARADVRWGVSRRILAGTAIGLPVGYLAIEHLDPRQLTVLTGVAVLLTTAAVAVGLRIPCTHPVAQSATGVLSGAFGVATGMTGPPVVIGLRGTELDHHETRATLSVTLGAAGASILLLRLLTGHIHADVVPVVALGLPAVAVGGAVGRWVFPRLGARRYSMLVVGLLAASGVTALLPR
jgi:uncharacterized membrane protein YfcA